MRQHQILVDTPLLLMPGPNHRHLHSLAEARGMSGLNRTRPWKLELWKLGWAHIFFFSFWELQFLGMIFQKWNALKTGTQNETRNLIKFKQ